MIPSWKVQAIRDLLAKNQFSQREIARRVAVGRGVVAGIASGTRPDYPASQSTGGTTAPQQPARRCPQCGATVHLPCVACLARRSSSSFARISQFVRSVSHFFHGMMAVLSCLWCANMMSFLGHPHLLALAASSSPEFLLPSVFSSTSAFLPSGGRGEEGRGMKSSSPRGSASSMIKLEPGITSSSRKSGGGVGRAIKREREDDDVDLYNGPSSSSVVIG